MVLGNLLGLRTLTLQFIIVLIFVKYFTYGFLLMGTNLSNFSEFNYTNYSLICFDVTLTRE